MEKTMRTCPICGMPFEPNAPAQRYCTPECRRRGARRRRKLRLEAPELPQRAGDLWELVDVLWHASNALAELARTSDPATAMVAGRLSDGVAAVMEREGLR